MGDTTSQLQRLPELSTSSPLPQEPSSDEVEQRVPDLQTGALFRGS